MKKVLVILSRFLFGITFIFSGFVKGIDPWGSAYKFNDYFGAMGLDWMIWAAFPLGILLSFAEFAIGAAFLFNLRIKLFSWLGLLFMAFFLPLTLWIAVKNPVTDCGCFGDAFIISNWDTFYKNIILSLFAIIVVVFRKDSKCLIPQKVANSAGIIVLLFYVFIVYYSYNHLPVIDFRPYKVGVNIPQSMTTPPDAPHDVYENTFFYKNKSSGEIKQFTEENYPWQDTANWEYSDMKSKLIQKGYEPPIHNFTIETENGENVVDFFINDENYVFILVAQNLEKSSRKSQEEINELASWAMGKGMSFICLTSSPMEEAYIFKGETGAPYEFFNCDEITLKTMIRSNPGLFVIKGGTILDKWHYNDIPTTEEFEKEYLQNE